MYSHLQPQAIQLSLISPHPGKTKPRWVQVSLAWIFHKESTKSIDASRVHLDRGPLQEINSPRGVVRPRQNARSRQRIRRVLEPQQRGIHSGFRSEEGFMARSFIAWCPLCQWHAAMLRGAALRLGAESGANVRRFKVNLGLFTCCFSSYFFLGS